MSEKSRDQKGRWRNLTIAFRVSPEENEAINEAVALSGLTKQEFIVSKLQDRSVVVMKNPRVFKMLSDKMDAILSELKRLKDTKEIAPEFWETVKYISDMYYRMEE